MDSDLSLPLNKQPFIKHNSELVGDYFVTSIFKAQRQADLRVLGQHGLQNEFQDYTEKPCLKNIKN